MAAASVCPEKLNCENDCREIHEKRGRLNLLGRMLACRAPRERQRIKETYMSMYGEDLIEHLHQAYTVNQKSEICFAMYMWMLDPHERDVVFARNAVEHMDTEYRALIEIYTCRKPSQLFVIRQAYQERFKRSLDHDIISDHSHPYQRILEALAASHKAHQTEINQHVAKHDAKRLYEAGKVSRGAIDEGVVLEIISKRSIPQLKLALSSYKHIYGHSYTKSLKKDTPSEFEESLRVVIRCMYDPPKYYSKMLYMSIKGMTADKSALARVIVTRAEVDMRAIEREFQDKYGVNMHEAINENIHNADYRDFLIALTTLSTSSSLPHEI